MENRVTIKLKRLDLDAAVPEFATPGSSGMDLSSMEEKTLLPGERHLFRIGHALEIPYGYEGQVRPRSGLALKHGITVLNSPGTIDSSFRGELGVILINLGQFPFTVHPKDRIAQLVIVAVADVTVQCAIELTETSRGSGGFGSTGR